MAVLGFGGGFAGVTGPSDRSLRREGSDGRGSAGAFRFGGIVGEMTRDSERRVRMVLWEVILSSTRRDHVRPFLIYSHNHGLHRVRDYSLSPADVCFYSDL